MEMQLVTFGLTIFSALISCGAAVVAVIYAKKPASVELQNSVDELMFIVEKMMKEARKVKMSNVRAAAKDNEPNKPDPEPLTEGLPVVDKKAALRMRLLGKKGL